MPDAYYSPFKGTGIAMGDDSVMLRLNAPTISSVPTLIVGKNDEYNCRLIASFTFDQRSWSIPQFIVGEKEFADELLIQKYPVFVVPKKGDSLELDRLHTMLEEAQQVIVLEHAGLSTLVEVSAAQEQGLPVFALTRTRKRNCRLDMLRGCGFLMKVAIRDAHDIGTGCISFKKE
jgi:hypothetical protein